MNIKHLYYVVEVAKTGTISQAAENLFMGQPNLSKALKEVEQTLNITIFNRTGRGVELTSKGREFVRYALNILRQYEELAALGTDVNTTTQKLYVSVPRASYIIDGFTSFLSELDMNLPIQIDLLETNALRTIELVSDESPNIGVIRCKTEYQNYFLGLLKERGLTSKLLLNFQYQVLLALDHPLCQKENIDASDLYPYLEIIHGDTAMPSLSDSISELERGTTPGDKKIQVYERGSQFDILSRVPGTYMWVSPMPEDLLSRNRLALIRCSNSPSFSDFLIYPQTHEFSLYEGKFIACVEQAIQNIL